MAVLMFQHRFASDVRSGKKRQTIRPARIHPIRVGNLLSLRQWTGKAYRSKQEVLAEGKCIGISFIKIGVLQDGYPDGILIDGIPLTTAERAAMARKDGFTCMSEMLDWFENEHGLPFEGTLIRWDLAPEMAEA